MPNGQAPDATSLAERLLQGLVVSGDMDFNLHSDGQRAPVPEKYVGRLVIWLLDACVC